MTKSKAERRREKRAKKMAKDRKNTAATTHRDLFPRLIVEPGNAPAALVAGVKEAAAFLRDNHEYRFPPENYSVYLNARKDGFMETHARLIATGRPGETGVLDFTEHAYVFPSVLQAILYEQKASLVTSFMPMNVLDIKYGHPDDRTIQIGFRSLGRAKGSGGTVYFSNHRPKVLLNGKAWTVAFSTHALEGICKRAVENWKEYVGTEAAFQLINGCLFYEDCSPNFSGGPAFTFYHPCHPRWTTWKYVEQILPSIDKGKKYYYRVGHCPVVFENGFAKAKTLLLPGMNKTPEWAAVMRSNLPLATKKQMCNDAEGNAVGALLQTREFDLLRWYHQNGVRQVVSFDHPVMQDELVGRVTLQMWTEIQGGRSPQKRPRWLSVLAAKLGIEFR